MKKILCIGLIPVALFLFNSETNAQLKNLIQHEKDKITGKTNNQSSGNSGNSNQSNGSSNNTAPDNSNQSETQTTSDQPSQPAPTITAYQNYDFRAGDKIIFEDNFASDQDGEFPAHWDLGKGQAVVNKVNGMPAFLMTDGNYCQVVPRMKTESYLTTNFSVEYDLYMTNGAYGMLVYFYNNDGNSMSVQTTSEGVQFDGPKSLSANHPTAIQYDNFYNKWHHVAIAYKNDQLKVYVDQYRILTVPHCDLTPVKLDCEGIGNQDNPIVFKNFKIADGASMSMIDKIMTDGKFVTHGINFDVNKATIKPESMGVIGDVVKYMQANPSLKLEIDGHTDSDGSDAANLTLSQQRADAVKVAMVTAGIDASRLTTKGFGESKPFGTNDTPEGKAMNRRVEFIKI